MGSACCGGRSTKNAQAKTVDATKEVFVEQQTKKPPPNPKFTSVPFDVIVPANSPAASPGTSGRLPPNASFLAFDQTMHTMRGDVSLNLSQRPTNNTFNFDANMSFTNNFADVNKDVVDMFLKNVRTIASGGDRTRNMLEESIATHGAESLTAVSADASMGPKVVGAGANELSPEDLDYINDGADAREKLARLAEVEEVLRQNIYGSWRMNSMLISLAFARVVPTLRQRRRPWNNPTLAANAPAGVAAAPDGEDVSAGAARSAKKPVVIVHARDLELSESVAGLVAAAPPQGEFNSPSHLDDNPSNPAPAASLKIATKSPTMDTLNRSMSRSGMNPTTATVEHYEMLALTCRDIDVKGKVGTKVIYDTWDFLADDTNTDALNRGECLFRFMCGPVHRFDQETLDIMNLFINQSSFADEEKDNNCPRVNVLDMEEAAKYICVTVKAMYMLPGTKLTNITAPMVSSREYQKACQPGSNKLEDCDVENTFRLSITVVRFVYSLTVMFRVSEITDPNTLFSFKSADGIVPAKVIMLERTKRNISKIDATAKVRSVLLYYPVNDGLLVNSHTFVLNTSIPNMVAKLVNTFGSQGAAQSAETAQLTRKYMSKTYGDSRQK